MHQKLKKLFALGMAGILTMSLAACGGKNQDSSANLPEFTYVPQYTNISVEGENTYVNLYNAKMAEGNV